MGAVTWAVFWPGEKNSCPLICSVPPESLQPRESWTQQAQATLVANLQHLLFHCGSISGVTVKRHLGMAYDNCQQVGSSGTTWCCQRQQCVCIPCLSGEGKAVPC